jgi:hypothetical protein
MADINLQRLLTQQSGRTAFAWAKYYESVRTGLAVARIQYRVLETAMTDNDVVIPTHIKNDFLEMASALRKKWECPICMELIECDQLEISNCGHMYCKPCLTQHKAVNSTPEGYWKCCVCRRRNKSTQAVVVPPTPEVVDDDND